MSGAIHLSSAMKTIFKRSPECSVQRSSLSKPPGLAAKPYTSGCHCALRFVVDHEVMWLAEIAFSQYLLSEILKPVSSQTLARP